MLDAPWDVDEQSGDDDQHPHVAHGKLADLVGIAKCIFLAKDFDYRCCPDLWAVDARESHDGGCDKQALGRTVEVA